MLIQGSVPHQGLGKGLLVMPFSTARPRPLNWRFVRRPVLGPCGCVGTTAHHELPHRWVRNGIEEPNILRCPVVPLGLSMDKWPPLRSGCSNGDPCPGLCGIFILRAGRTRHNDSVPDEATAHLQSCPSDFGGARPGGCFLCAAGTCGCVHDGTFGLGLGEHPLLPVDIWDLDQVMVCLCWGPTLLGPCELSM